jgi:uncharacterized membrane protein YgcG
VKVAQARFGSLLVALGCVLTLAASSPAAGAVDGTIAEAASALRTSPVFVDDQASPTLSEQQAARLRRQIEGGPSAPLYIAILPAAALAEAGGDPVEVLRELRRRVGRRGTYAVVVGGRFRAGSDVLPRGRAGELATEAFDARGRQGVAATLSDFVSRVGAERGGEAVSEPDGDGGIGAGLVVVLVVAGLVGFFALRRRRRRQTEFRRVREEAERDLVALAEDVQALEDDVGAPGASPRARDEYQTALSAYERASDAFERARSTDDLASVSSSVEEGRYRMAAARAIVEGEPIPDRRPPCFFDPRHGPSVRDVFWAPDGVAPRLVPACESDARRVEQGLDPEAREIEIRGQRLPYWNAPAYFSPWAGGYFGGFGVGGLFTGLLIGGMLGGPFAGSAFGYGGVEGAGGGDFGDGGGGDFGDFGGGDFGGGDFGGGDFGGGGDF